MTILEVLKNTNIRIDNGDRWLVLDETNEFIVYECKYRQRKIKTVYRGESEEEAVEVLLNRVRKEAV